MIRKLLILLAFAPPLFADSAELTIVRLTSSKPAVMTGETVTVSMIWRNNGPDAANDVVATFAVDSGGFVITGLGPSRTPCTPIFGGNGFQCSAFQQQPGEEEQITVTMIARSDLAEMFTLHATLSASTPDPDPFTNSDSMTLPVTASGSQADLAIGPASQEHRVTTGAEIAVPLIVRNDGPSNANDVYVSLGFDPGSLLPMSASGDGWTCQNPTHAPWLVLCRRATLANGATSTITVRATAPDEAQTKNLYARVAASNVLDPIANNGSTAKVQVGDPAAPQQGWTRILVPLPPGVTGGANNARWTTKTTALLRSRIEIRPGLCETVVPFPCPDPPVIPLMRPVDLAQFQISGGGLGQFLIVRDEDASQIRVNSRVWDEARQTETAGSEIPIPRDDDFTEGTTSLLGIPLAPHYRHTLRVYDLDGHDDALVEVRIYADEETTPRSTTLQHLDLSPFAFRTVDELWTRPASLQLDPLQLVALTGATKMRIDVVPLHTGLKIWSFVSVTNNETHHVTTFSKQ
jgi:uncharacterized repeat protein (TIGR01451 family)